MDGYNWSFSGLKTQVLHFLTREQRADPTFVNAGKRTFALPSKRPFWTC